MILFKIFKNIILMLLIMLVILVPFSIYLIKFKSSSLIGEWLKGFSLNIPKLVEVLNLNSPGDGKYFYLEPKNKSLSIGIFSVNSNKPNEKIGIWLGEIIAETVNRNVIITNPQFINYSETELLTNEDLNNLRKVAISKGKYDLYLIYASSYSDKETSVGVVIHRDSIFLFKNAIERLSERGYIKDLLEKTTIMHEWGHLLGMDHVDEEGCIMNESVEVLDASPTGKNLPTKYCWEELQELKQQD